MPYAALENAAPERAPAAHRDERLSPPSALTPDVREEFRASAKDTRSLFFTGAVLGEPECGGVPWLPSRA